MKLRTEIRLPQYPFAIDQQTPLLLLGSCFSQNIRVRLERGKFDALVNPCGISYNPMSIHDTLLRLCEDRVFEDQDIKIIDDAPFPFYHHGSFRKRTFAETKVQIDKHWNHALLRFPSVQTSILTWGTAFVWERDGVIVNNCHKRPHAEFTHRLLSVSEIVNAYVPLIQQLSGHRVLINISPIRHLHAGLSKNNLSKSVLRLAAELLCQQFQNVHYFPSFEMVVDDLRDYRFYAADLVHPSELAIEYVWKNFQDALVTKEAQQAMKELEKLQTRLRHRALAPESESYRIFVEQTRERLQAAKLRFPNGDWSEENLLFAVLRSAIP